MSTLYGIWKNCMHLGILPPRVKKAWSECDEQTKALILVFNQIRKCD